MEHSRKQKLMVIIALVVGIASLSIGFAAFSTTLNISSSASVSPSSDTFSVKFSTSKDSLVVNSVAPSSNPYNLNVTNGVINNMTNPTLSNLSTTFTEPGQTVVYRVYARNEGEYTAYLNNINFIGDKTCTADFGTTESLVQSACDDINVHVVIDDISYDETTTISGHSLDKGNGEEILIVLEYVNSGTRVDGGMSITFPSVSLVYSTVDDSTIQPHVVRLESGDLNTPGSIVSIGNEKFYVIGQEDGNVKLLSMYNLYVGNIASKDEDDNIVISPLLNPTGVQDENARGFAIADNQNDYPFVGTVEFSSDIQKGTEYSDYTGSIIEGYVNNYASYLEELGANIEEARLITKSELETLGCSGNSCSGAPEFVYKTSYWTMTPNATNYVWFVNTSKSLNTSIILPSASSGIGPILMRLGVRPVIEISVSNVY